MDISKVTKNKIMELVKMTYPEDKIKDVDGDWIDKNIQLREGFINGFEMAVYVNNLSD